MHRVLSPHAVETSLVVRYPPVLKTVWPRPRVSWRMRRMSRPTSDPRWKLVSLERAVERDCYTDQKQKQKHRIRIWNIETKNPRNPRKPESRQRRRSLAPGDWLWDPGKRMPGTKQNMGPFWGRHSLMGFNKEAHWGLSMKQSLKVSNFPNVKNTNA